MSLHGWPVAAEAHVGLVLEVISTLLPRGVQHGVLELVGEPAPVRAAPPGGEPPDAAMIGFEIGVRLPAEGQAGRYVIWLRVAAVGAALEVAPHAVDERLGQPAPSLPPSALLALLVAFFPPQRFTLPAGLQVAPRSALSNGARRLVLFASLTPRSGLGPGSPAARLEGPSLLHRPGEGLGGGGLLGLHMGEALAIAIDGEVLRRAMEGAVHELHGAPLDPRSPETRLHVHRFRVPALRPMGADVDFDIELRTDGAPPARFSAVGPIYVGGVLEDRPSRGLRFQLALNATGLAVGGLEGAGLGLLKMVSLLSLAFAPPLFHLLDRHAVAQIDGATRGLRDAAQRQLDDALSGLLRDAAAAMPPGPLAELVARALLTRIAIGADGLVLGVGAVPAGDAAGGGAARAEGPQLQSVSPARVIVGYHAVGDCFPAVATGASIRPTGLGGAPTLGGGLRAHLAPAGPAVPQHPVITELDLLGDRLDGVSSAHLTRDGAVIGELPILQRSARRLRVALTLRGLQPGTYGLRLEAPGGAAWRDGALEAGLALSGGHPMTPRALVDVGGVQLALMDGGLLGPAPTLLPAPGPTVAGPAPATPRLASPVIAPMAPQLPRLRWPGAGG